MFAMDKLKTEKPAVAIPRRARLFKTFGVVAPFCKRECRIQRQRNLTPRRCGHEKDTVAGTSKLTREYFADMLFLGVSLTPQSRHSGASNATKADVSRWCYTSGVTEAVLSFACCGFTSEGLPVCAARVISSYKSRSLEFTGDFRA
jgi:hypothetical protein